MNKKKLDQVVYEYIVTQIDNGQLLEREHITEQTIANTLEISRTPVRKAFDRLVADEYLENIENIGVRVKVPVLTSIDFQHRLDFFERSVNHYLFDLEKKEVTFEVMELHRNVNLMDANAGRQASQFNEHELHFWQALLSYDTNRYTKKTLLKTIRECLEVTGYIKDIMEDSQPLKVRHCVQIMEYLHAGDYPNSRREIRILLNQLKLNVIEMGLAS